MIVVCGEALMDVFAAGETPAGLLLDARCGGSPFNVAIGLARLGRPVAYLGGLSADAAGRRLRAALAAEGVDTRLAPELDAPTTLVMVDVAADGRPGYRFLGTGAADRLLPASAAAALPEAARVLQLGSYALVVEPVASVLRALVEREHRRLVVACDPNVRPGVEPDVARWREALEWMAPRCRLLKASDEDLAWLYPGADPADVARGWLAAGVELAVVTRGERGASAWTATAEAHRPAPPVALADTVGAGDTVQAALLAWLAERDRLQPGGLSLEAAELGAALGFALGAAALTCSRRGADLPRRAELPPA
ncbi:carbohydrate kinase family protein [Rubrivivax benzoatilyticus]|uniref:Carbohydrate kinase n=1 Tax=Rubrivivax benzoatilyticus TaxID=316997 RepID=A0ABX0HSC8_9BURK|nr:carbohydrate kinase [Rubrivivax benzoatilyticus]EGJ09950.1 ribokinase-like domain-containing protein [Rubrivivax benzoatilyticus JA2 = ATCC BAA-35]NHK97949.1 carbohydrate kinase [Rubrivivax benzoatilyticus]NHL23451.1 carbohydrate kinase [Rubrivivax benzoatilyticus]